MWRQAVDQGEKRETHGIDEEELTSSPRIEKQKSRSHSDTYSLTSGPWYGWACPRTANIAYADSLPVR
jgi:hypothetical protein